MADGPMEKGLIDGQSMDERGKLTSPQVVERFWECSIGAFPGVWLAQTIEHSTGFLRVVQKGRMPIRIPIRKVGGSQWQALNFPWDLES
jgi:hypothetical protein